MAKAHRVSSTAYAIAHATGENTTNIQRILNGANANHGLRTLTAIVGHFEVGLVYLDCKTASDCQAYLAQHEVDKANAEISEAELLAQLAASARGLRPAGWRVLISMTKYLKRLDKEGKLAKP